MQTTTCVIRELTFPPTPLDSLDYGLDVDGAPAALSAVDNKLGSFAGRMNLSFGFEFTAHANVVLAGGEWRMELGTCAEEPEFLRVMLMPDAPESLPAEGTIVENRLEARLGFGRVPLGTLLDLSTTEISAIAWYQAVAIAVTATMDGDAVDGIVAGAFSAMDGLRLMDESVLTSFNFLIANDAGCPDDCATSTGRALTDRFDDNKDGTLSAAEFRADSLRTSGLFPDVDLDAVFEGETTFWPNWDGDKDNFSFGLRFHADSCLPSS